MPIETFEMGNRVVCDDCGDEWTGRPESGGILFGSKACCPKCAPGMEAGAKRYGEEAYIRGRCPPGMSYADWVVKVLRGGEPATVRILTGDDAMDAM